MRLELGAPVKTREGKDVGRIDKLVINPTTGEVAAAVVRRGFILHRDVEIPLSALFPDEEDDVRVNCTAEDIETWPEFVEGNYTTSPPAGTVSPDAYPTGGLVWPAAGPAVTTEDTALDRGVGELRRRQDEDNDDPSFTEGH